MVAKNKPEFLISQPGKKCALASNSLSEVF